MRARRVAQVAALGLTCVMASCHPGPGPYDAALERAEKSRRARDFDGEQEHFRAASTLSKHESDQVEALYREAHSLQRQGHLRRAREALRMLAKEHPSSSRSARAWLDAGRISDDLYEPKEARDDYMHVLREYPGSGGAKRAAERLAELNALEGRPLAETYRHLLESTLNADLEQELRMLLADSLRDSDPRQSIEQYEALARRAPLPDGTLTDDALLASAELRRHLGDAEGARDLLAFLLSYDTHAVLIGSYTRVSFIKAYFLKSQIEAAELQSPTSARQTLAVFIEKHPRSRYLDDAWWNIARLDERLGRKPCTALDKLSLARPQSRLASCRRVLCPVAGPSAEGFEGRCRTWWDEGSGGPLSSRAASH